MAGPTSGPRLALQWGVIYFFEKDRSFVQCEIHPGRPHVLTVIRPDGGVEHAEHYSSDSLESHWCDVCQRLSHDGWRGPFGRDARD